MSRKQLIWTAIMGSLPFVLTVICQFFWSFNTHWNPINWGEVPGLTLFIFCISWLSFGAGEESVNNGGVGTQ